jgi:hypothetical protein
MKEELFAYANISLAEAKANSEEENVRIREVTNQQ